MEGKTLREAVEKILSFHTCEYDGQVCSDMTLDKYKERPSCEQCRVDRICAEVEKLAVGMPNIHPEITSCCANELREKCQAFIRKELQ